MIRAKILRASDPLVGNESQKDQELSFSILSVLNSIKRNPKPHLTPRSWPLPPAITLYITHVPIPLLQIPAGPMPLPLAPGSLCSLPHSVLVQYRQAFQNHGACQVSPTAMFLPSTLSQPPSPQSHLSHSCHR